MTDRFSAAVYGNELPFQDRGINAVKDINDY